MSSHLILGEPVFLQAFRLWLVISVACVVSEDELENIVC